MKLYLLICSTLTVFLVETVADSVIRIPAYDPKPPLVHDRLLARRIGTAAGIIQDPPQEIYRNNRPLIPQKAFLRRKLHRRPERSENGTPEEIVASNSPLPAINPDMLRNPIGAVSPPGLPTLGSSTGVVRPPSVNLPAPPFPPFGPPSPPTIPSTIGPPSPPQPYLTPSPPLTNRESIVTKIKCIEFDDQKIFQALLSLPSGYETIPVLEDRNSIDLTTNPVCRVIPTTSNFMFNLILSEFEECGVRKCRQSNGETWNCLIIRFPLINGIKLPEDELVEIRCRPHDKTADDSHILSVATAKYADKDKILADNPPTVFEGSQEFLCEIGLFRQIPGTQEFTSRITAEDSIELGEKVQLWSIVKSGDGWSHSRLTEVVILKEDSNKERSLLNTLVLVYSDGCRNPNYKVIAENHPIRDSRNPLINKFTFRVFMFQDMQPGDSLLISARVMGCIRREDCEPTVCGDDGIPGYGRKKRDVKEQEFNYTTRYTIPSNKAPYPPIPPNPSNSYLHSSSSSLKEPNTTNWSRNMAIRVKMPGQGSSQRTIEFRDCKLYLYISLGIGIVFFIISTTCVAFTTIKCNRKLPRQDSKPIPGSSKGKLKKPKPKKSLQLQISSASSEGNYTSSTESTASANHLRDLPVPSTVKHRKKKVNTELMNLFGNEEMIPYNSQYPPMMNYYGYMVVPRPQHNQKKTVRAIKRTGNVKLPLNEPYRKRGKKIFVGEGCYCKSTHSSSLSSDDLSSCHKSIIKITTSGENSITSGCNRPHPKPRSRVCEPIYNEIRQDMEPTMV